MDVRCFALARRFQANLAHLSSENASAGMASSSNRNVRLESQAQTFSPSLGNKGRSQ